MADYTSGNWHAATLGQFVGQIVDSGDEAVAFRLVETTGLNEEGRFSQRWEVILIAKGSVVETIQEYGCESIHKSLKALIQAGIVY